VGSERRAGVSTPGEARGKGGEHGAAACWKETKRRSPHSRSDVPRFHGGGKKNKKHPCRKKEEIGGKTRASGTENKDSRTQKSRRKRRKSQSSCWALSGPGKFFAKTGEQHSAGQARQASAQASSTTEEDMLEEAVLFLAGIESLGGF